MKLITINPNNEPYYSEDYIKGFQCGAQRQFEADKADRPQGEWINSQGRPMRLYESYSANCSACGEWSEYLTEYCPHCGARMKGADDDQ